MQRVEYIETRTIGCSDSNTEVWASFGLAVAIGELSDAAVKYSYHPPSFHIYVCRPFVFVEALRFAQYLLPSP